jgi:hypothetical protein
LEDILLLGTSDFWGDYPSAMQTGSQSGIDPETYYHSIINEASKLLIYKGLSAGSALFTVTFTVNLI